jgi:hypothetical protein
MTDPSSAAPGRSRSCPICGKPADPNRRPFCSKRCADVDLNRWLTGSYRVPTDEPADPGSDPARHEREDP